MPPKKQSYPAQSTNLLTFFSKGLSPTPSPAKRKRSSTTPAVPASNSNEGGSIFNPVSLLDDSDDEDCAENAGPSKIVKKATENRGGVVATASPPSGRSRSIEMARGARQDEKEVSAQSVTFADLETLPVAGCRAGPWNCLASSPEAQQFIASNDCPPASSSSSTKSPQEWKEIVDVDLTDDSNPGLEQDVDVWGDMKDDEQADQEDEDEDDDAVIIDQDWNEGGEDTEMFEDQEEGLYLDQPQPSTSTSTSSTKRLTRITAFHHSTLSSSTRSTNPLPRKPPAVPNAFSVLMSKTKEPDLWKTAEVDQYWSKPGGGRENGLKRKAPFFKIMTGMPIAVDAFRYGAIPGVTAYFLSHAHSDHYTNLSKSWQHGPIYSSPTTSNLIVHLLGVDPKWVHPVSFNETFEIPNTNGVKVTLVEANHCPGSALFVFEGRQTVDAGENGFPSGGIGSKKMYRYLHCGDFRASPKHVRHPAVASRPLDQVYLDTTYLNPKYCFPSQPEVISACADLIKMRLYGAASVGKKENALVSWINNVAKTEEEEAESNNATRIKAERTLVVIGTYSIGKERIVKAVAQAINSKIYCDARKRTIIADQEDDPELHPMISDDPAGSQVHIVPLSDIQLEPLGKYLHRYKASFDRVIGLRPTGWTYGGVAGQDLLPDLSALIAREQKRVYDASSFNPSRGSSEKITMYGVPYSEHSSFFELSCFALSLPGAPRMIATVNIGSQTSRQKMQAWFNKWEQEKKKRDKAKTPKMVPPRNENYW